MSELSFRIILRVSALEHLLVFMSYDSMISSSTTSTIWRNRELRHGISKILIYRQVVVYWDSVPDGSLNDPFLNKCVCVCKSVGVQKGLCVKASVCQSVCAQQGLCVEVAVFTRVRV